MKTVEIYTDGSCSGNPGPGGWAAILQFGPHEKVLTGNMNHTTNNRMELFAVISALGALNQPCTVNVHSDSAYIVNAFQQGWISNWQKNGWKNTEGKPVENTDLWRLLLLVIQKHDHDVHFIKVPGHADCEINNRCDQLAREEVTKFLKLNPDLTDNADAENNGGSVS